MNAAVGWTNICIKYKVYSIFVAFCAHAHVRYEKYGNMMIATWHNGNYHISQSHVMFSSSITGTLIRKFVFCNFRFKEIKMLIQLSILRFIRPSGNSQISNCEMQIFGVYKRSSYTSLCKSFYTNTCAKDHIFFQKISFAAPLLSIFSRTPESQSQANPPQTNT